MNETAYARQVTHAVKPGTFESIAERPNLLLKRSGRVNRILGPEEDLSDALRDSLRQTRRQGEQ